MESIDQIDTYLNEKIIEEVQNELMENDNDSQSEQNQTDLPLQDSNEVSQHLSLHKTLNDIVAQTQIHQSDVSMIQTDQNNIAQSLKDENSKVLYQRNNYENKYVNYKRFDKHDKSNIQKIGLCHNCKTKDLIVYSCFQDHIPTSCYKLYCERCLKRDYNENITEIVLKSNTWKCPFKRRICVCNNCYAKKKSIHIEQNIQSKPEQSQFQNTVDSNNNQNKPQMVQEFFQKQARKKLIKNLLEFNGELIKKFQQNYSTLNEQEIIFYNNLMFENLQKLQNLSEFVQDNDLFFTDM